MILLTSKPSCDNRRHFFEAKILASSVVVGVAITVLNGTQLSAPEFREEDALGLRLTFEVRKVPSRWTYHHAVMAVTKSSAIGMPLVECKTGGIIVISHRNHNEPQ
jgi:hypothetical protein